MLVKTLYFTSLLFTALTLAPGMAHLLALPNKIHLPADDYLTVQQIYRGWALLGGLQVLALLSSLLLTIVTRHHHTFILNGLAFLCMLASLIIFFLFTFPANQQTDNWTKLPENWESLRRQWEYSHAVNAGIFLAALVVLVVSVINRQLQDSP